MYGCFSFKNSDHRFECLGFTIFFAHPNFTGLVSESVNFQELPCSAAPHSSFQRWNAALALWRSFKGHHRWGSWHLLFFFFFQDKSQTFSGFSHHMEIQFALGWGFETHLSCPAAVEQWLLAEDNPLLSHQWRIATESRSTKPRAFDRAPSHHKESAFVSQALGQKLWWPFSRTRPAEGAIRCHHGEKIWQVGISCPDLETLK